MVVTFKSSECMDSRAMHRQATAFVAPSLRKACLEPSVPRTSVFGHLALPYQRLELFHAGGMPVVLEAGHHLMDANPVCAAFIVTKSIPQRKPSRPPMLNPTRSPRHSSTAPVSSSTSRSRSTCSVCWLRDGEGSHSKADDGIRPGNAR
jgi:hypothetical protein